MPSGNLTKLEGVNRILRAAREEPVASLGETTLNDTVLAEQVLNEVIQREQMTGQHVNTTETSFTRNASNKVVLPENTLQVYGSNQHACRNFFHKEVSGEILLFDADQFPATSDFSSDGANLETVYVRITQVLDFEEMPAPLQFSIVDQAAVEYQMAVLGDPNLDADLKQRAARSRAEARAYDMRSQPHNQFGPHASATGPIAGRLAPRTYRDRTHRRQP